MAYSDLDFIGFGTVLKRGARTQNMFITLDTEALEYAVNSLISCILEIRCMKPICNMLLTSEKNKQAFIVLILRKDILLKIVDEQHGLSKIMKRKTTSYMSIRVNAEHWMKYAENMGLTSIQLKAEKNVDGQLKRYWRRL